MANKRNQQGFSLFMVMIMMIVIALLVVITSQSTSTESRLSANEADRKYALSQAEIGLRSGEDDLNKIYNRIKPDPTTGAPTSKANLIFTVACRNGLCAPVEKVELIESTDEEHFKIDASENGTAQIPAWEREGIFTNNNTSKPSTNGKARYIIEYMGQRTDGGPAINDYFRVTSRANGENPNTVVTLQSYVEMTRTK